MLKSITLRNYRSFDDRGATLPLDQEFVGIVGVNNSGKSSLLRAIYELRPLFQALAQFRANSGEFHQALMNGLPLLPLQLLPGERVFPAWDENLNPRVTVNFAHESITTPGLVRGLTLTLSRDSGARIELVMESGAELSRAKAAGGVAAGVESGIAVVVSTENILNELVDWNEVVPHLQRLAGAMYVGPFRNAVNAGGAAYYDLAVGRDFISAFNDFKTGSDYNANQAIEVMSDRIGEIFGISRFGISASSDGSHLVFMLENKAMRGSELGAGISQFVIVATNVLVRQPTLLLIDEPELGLHASLQLQFLSLLASFVGGTVAFASHSLGLTRSAADQVLVASRLANGVSVVGEYQTDPNLSLTLGELGYGGMHDAAYKAVLLVEGVSDVLVFQELLVKYGVRGDVVIVQLGGDDLATSGRMAELAELRKLSDNVFAIVDSERSDHDSAPAARRTGFQENCASIGIDCLVLDRRATENYLNQQIGTTVNGLAEEADFGFWDKPPSGWSKSRNWRIAQRMSIDDIAGTDLALFLSKLAAELHS